MSSPAPERRTQSLFPPHPPLPRLVLPDNLPDAFCMMEAQRQEAAGQWVNAEAMYWYLLDRQPRFHPAWHALGLLAFQATQLKLAKQYFRVAVSIDANNGIYHRNLGEVSRLLGDIDEAIASGFRALSLLPGDPDTRIKLGSALADAKRFDEAIKHIQEALRLEPANAMGWNNLGTALEGIDDWEGAKAAYANANRIEPDSAESLYNLGRVMMVQGSIEPARRRLEAALAIRPTFFEAHVKLSETKKYTANDPHIAIMKAMVKTDDFPSENARIRLLFALGKALEDAGRYDEAFSAYEEGNRRHYALRPFDEAPAVRFHDGIRGVFSPEFLARKAGQGQNEDVAHPDNLPVFVVGMPRSGTTLVEQILASHPSVHGTGESLSFINAALRVSGLKNIDGFPEWLASADPHEIACIGQDCLADLRKAANGARVIVDKTPVHFAWIGAIRLALPDARIIHIRRDPLDTCLSCYSICFETSMDFASDFGMLGRFFRRYESIMAHWKSVLPENSILDVRYEELIDRPEEQARRLVEHVGLPWDERALEFHKNKRPVKTASFAQVRRPIYKTSLLRWQRFERHLGPLRDALGIGSDNAAPAAMQAGPAQ